MMTAKVLRHCKSMFFFSSSAWSLWEKLVGSSEGGPTWTAAYCVDFRTSPGGAEASCCWPYLMFSFFRPKVKLQISSLLTANLTKTPVTVIWEQVAIIRLFLRHPSVCFHTRTAHRQFPFTVRQVWFASLLRCCKPLCSWSLLHFRSCFLSCALVLISLLVDIVSSQWVVLPKWKCKMKYRLSNYHL